MKDTPWTPETVDLMMQLVAQGRSMGEIGIALGRTRNAIIGKVQRERIIRGHVPIPRKPILVTLADGSKRLSPQALRNTTPKRVCEPRRAMPGVSTQGIGRILPALTPPPPRSGPAAGILDVTGCRWPTGSDETIPGTHTFCDATQDGKGPYCPFHEAQKVAKPVPMADRARARMTVSQLRMVG